MDTINIVKNNRVEFAKPTILLVSDRLFCMCDLCALSTCK